MKNDLDFIKKKIENSGVNAPEDMDREFALDKLGEVEQETVAKKRSFKKPAAIAASIAVVTAAAITAATLVPSFTAPKNIASPAALPASVRQFKNYDEVKSELKKINESREILYSGSDVAYAVDDADGFAFRKSSPNLSAKEFGTGGGSGEAHAETYKQVENVDEPDVVKTDGRYIYTVSEQAVVIYSAEGKSSKKVSELKLSEHYESFANELFIDGDRLILLYTTYVKRDTATPDEANFYYTSFPETHAKVYDISDIKNIRELSDYGQSGGYASARMIGGKLVLVSNDAEYFEDVIPYTTCGTKKNDIAANCIYCVEKPQQKIFVNVSSVEPSSGKAETKSILGVCDDIYCSESNLYVTAYNGYSFYGAYSFIDKKQKLDATTQIVKFNLDGGLNVAASGKVDGRLYDRYALDEKDGRLRAATTTVGKDGKDTNNLFVLDESLKKLGAVTDFAKDESIKAVKYVGDTAYVITYEETDPLFVIDLSDSKKPEILGEVKISGFSSMLVPVDEKTVLGIGYSTEDGGDEIDMEITDGLKLALFDVSDKLNPRVVDSKVFEGVYSDVQYDPRALVVNPDRGNYTIPFNGDEYDEAKDEYIQNCGALTFGIKDGKLNIEEQYTSSKLSDEVSRCTFVGNNIYLLNLFDGEIDSTSYK